MVEKRKASVYLRKRDFLCGSKWRCNSKLCVSLKNAETLSMLVSTERKAIKIFDIFIFQKCYL